MLRLVTLFALAALGCSSAAQRAPEAADRPENPSSSAPLSDQHGTARSEAEIGGESAKPAEARAASAPAKEPILPGLQLPVDSEFLQTPLPPPVPDRYASWRETSRINVGLGYLTEVDRLPSGKWLTLSQDDGKVRVYDGRTRRLVTQHPVPGFQQFDHVALVAWPSGDDRFVRGATDGLRVHDAASGAELQLADERPTWQLRWSADRRVLMAVGPGATEQTSVLRCYERRGERLVALGEQPFAERVDAWDLSPDGRLLAVALFPSDTLRVFDLRDGGRELHARAAPRYTGDVAFSPDGRFLAAAGDGLLVVDLINPERVGFYSYVKNNMGFVRFSPSGDAVAASSYDGKIRILGVSVTSEGRLELTLLRELSHSGQANVYGFAFSADGQELVSGSGDRTLRAFGGRTVAQGAAGTAFHDLDTWRKLEPRAARPLAKPDRSTREDGRLILPSERAPMRPSRVRPGRYACKLTLIYKLRPCWVYQDPEGRTLLEFSPDNLLHLGGVLWDDGAVVRFEGKLLSPSDVLGCAGCDQQPLHAVLRGQGGKYTGVLTFRQYYDPFVPPLPPPPNVQNEEANDRFPLVLEWVGPHDTSVE